MGNWKHLTLSGVMMLGLSLGLTGCPEDDDNTCTEPSDCESGACDQLCGICIDAPCDSDEDCTDGTVCRTACEGGTATQCLPPDGNGGDQCEENIDCYAETGYCADLMPADCVSYDCGTMFNDCNQCALAPDSGAKSATGPVVFLPEQVDVGDDAVTVCRKDPACGAQENVCRFSASFYPAAGQTITGSAYEKIWLVTANAKSCTRDADCGSLKCKDGVCMTQTFETTSISGDTFSWEGCYDPTNLTPGGVVVLFDDAGNRSNALCFTGTAP